MQQTQPCKVLSQWKPDLPAYTTKEFFNHAARRDWTKRTPDEQESNSPQLFDYSCALCHSYADESWILYASLCNRIVVSAAVIKKLPLWQNTDVRGRKGPIPTHLCWLSHPGAAASERTSTAASAKQFPMYLARRGAHSAMHHPLLYAQRPPFFLLGGGNRCGGFFN